MRSIHRAMVGRLCNRLLLLLVYPAFVCSNEANIGKVDDDCSSASFYCENGVKTQCGSVHIFCKAGTSKPTIVHKGHYTIGSTELMRTGERLCEPGTYCIDGERKLCPAGHFGDSYGLVSENCTGLCSEGYHCPNVGSVIATQVPCGDPSKYCPLGSVFPLNVNVGFYLVGKSPSTRVNQQFSPPGHYAVDGLLFKCPAGRYGDTLGASKSLCSGVCEGGYFCPPGSTSPRQVACGGEDKLCPGGSTAPLFVRSGYYTTTSYEGCRPGMWRNKTGAVDHSVHPITLHSAVPTTTEFTSCVPCNEGTYKFQQGDSQSLCLNCPFMEARSNADRSTCECFRILSDERFENLFFNITSNKCQSVGADHERPPDIHIEPGTQLTKKKEYACEKGFWCQAGIRRPCPSGSYGKRTKETSASCNGNCDPGYWCSEASTSSTQNQCGSPKKFCPSGSKAPKFVSNGYESYNQENERVDKKILPLIRDSQRICPAGKYCKHGIRYECAGGTWGSKLGLSQSQCEGKCIAGYFCPPGSTHNKQIACGNVTVHCPEGSASPKVTDVGFYSFHGQIDSTLMSSLDERNETMIDQVACEKGYWCADGIKYQCKEGTYGWFVGASRELDCKFCSAGYYCPSYPSTPSTNWMPKKCGGPHKFCPEGSAKPLSVQTGYYSIGKANITEEDDRFVRASEQICPLGFYCENGLKFKCPAGVYGNSTGLVHKSCSGWCPASFTCAEGSTKPIECPINTYSTHGAHKCIECGGSSLDNGVHQRCRTSRLCCAA